MSARTGVREAMDLNGQWSFELDPDRAGEERGWPTNLRAERIRVPGSWQENGFGEPDPHQELKWPMWRHRYHGVAWYAREVTVDPSWIGSRIVLQLERVNWMTRCWVNGALVGEGESLATPQRFDLTDHLRPGHTDLIALSVDSWRPEILNYQEWQRSPTASGNPGGLLGPAQLLRRPRAHVDHIAIRPNLSEGVAHCRLILVGVDHLPGGARVVCRARGWTDAAGDAGATIDAEFRNGLWLADVPVPTPVRPWSPSDPFLYEVEVAIIGAESSTLDRFQERFGMREIHRDGRMLLLNGQPVFLRMDVDFMTFPSHGYPPADKATYTARFRKYKEYGFNGTRCHSWTPPRAYFEAADEAGMLVQSELPNWSNMLDPVYVEQAGPFLAREWERIISELQPHPSLIAHCLGNELLSTDPQGRYGVHAPWINERIRLGHELDPTRLYVDNSGFTRVPAETECISDILVPGVITGGSPDTRGNYLHYMRGADRPVIAHEHALLPSYPNPADEELCQGNFVPTYLQRTREALAAKDMLDQLPDFLRAAGHQQVIYEKELFEKVRRTPGMVGWHMNSFVDKPAYNGSPAGYVDMCFRDKGYTRPEEVRGFTDDTVVLLSSLARNYFGGESLTAEILVSHFGGLDADGIAIQWQLSGNTAIVAHGELPTRRIPAGKVTVVGNIEIDLPAVADPATLTLRAWAEVHGRKTQNQWTFWVFPSAVLRRADRPITARACYQRW